MSDDLPAFNRACYASPRRYRPPITCDCGECRTCYNRTYQRLVRRLHPKIQARPGRKRQKTKEPDKA